MSCSRAETRSSAPTQRLSNMCLADSSRSSVDRLLVRPGVAIDPRGDERVVHVADGEDAGLEVELGLVEAAGVAAAVEPLVVVEHEPAHGRGEVAELAEQVMAPLGMPADDRELVLRERARLLQDPVGDGELADVVEQAAGREAAEPARRKAELLADLHGQERDAARVLLRVGVLAGEAQRERADAGAEEGLFRRDEARCGRAAGERVRLGGAVQVECDRGADEHEPDELEAVAEPPAELHEVVHERAHERGGEEAEADEDERVAEPLGEKEGVERAQRDVPVRGETAQEEQPAPGRSRSRAAPGGRRGRRGRRGRTRRSTP